MSNFGNPPSDPYGQNPQVPAAGGEQPQVPANGGEQPQDPYTQPQDAYAQPQAAYGANPYGGPTQVGSGYGLPQGVAFASWGQRVAASLIDGLIAALIAIPAVLGIIMFVASVETTIDPVTGVTSSESTGGTGPAVALMALGFLLAIAFTIWNTFIRQGKTGYTIGKGVMGIKLIKAETGQPLGVGMTFLRYIVTQAISSITCGVGGLVDLLWPLWDDKNQTLHDKAVGSVVIDQPKV